MFTREELRNNLIGCAEIVLFMPNGVGRYDPSKSSAVRSFLVTLFLMPVVIAMWVFRAGSAPVSLVVGLHFAQMVLATILFLTVVYFLSKQYERQEHFFRFITVSNWQGVSGIALALPILVAIMLGGDLAVWESYAIFVAILGYVYTGFIATHAFRLPWEMGAFIGVISLAVSQESLKLVGYLQDYLTVGV